MLLMKAWLETRWRLGFYLGVCFLFLAVDRHSSQPVGSHGMVIYLGAFLAFLSLAVAGCGVKSQAPVGFPEGLAGSTQFTISLPVSRLRLLTVRAAVGMLECCAATVVIGLLVWRLFPSMRAGATAADFAGLLLTTVVFLTGPYCAAVFFATFVDEPFSMVFAGWTITLLLCLAHKIAPAVDIVRAWSDVSPLLTHKLPWSQLAASAVIGGVMFLAAVRVVQTREY